MEDHDIPDDYTSTHGPSDPIDKTQCLHELKEDSTFKLTLISHCDPIFRKDNPPANFDPIDLTLKDGIIFKIGRPVRTSDNPLDNPSAIATAFEQSELNSDKEGIPIDNTSNSNASDSSPVHNVWFKSKVVSRNHAQMWATHGQVY